MSVLIKGMEMPENCDKCELMTANYGCALVGAVGGESYRKRAWDCPLVEVPTPHGRLIDADAMMNSLPMEYPSNADRIRSMTDEELAEWIAYRQGCFERQDKRCSKYGTCRDCWFDWLKEECE